jgi:hypothetical protein
MPDMTLAEIRSVLAEQVLSFGITSCGGSSSGAGSHSK